MTAASPTTLTVTDRALAKLATNEATAVAGVVRLHAAPRQLARDTVRRAGRPPRTSRALADVERGRGGCVVTVRVTARTRPPVLETVGAVQRQVAGALARIAGVEATVSVQVLDVEPS